MGKEFPGCVQADPSEPANFMRVWPADSTENLRPYFSRRACSRLGRPVENVLYRYCISLFRCALFVAGRYRGLFAFISKRIAYMAEEHPEPDRYPCLFLYFACCAVENRFIALQLAFRPAPVIIFRTVNNTDFNSAVSITFSISGSGIVRIGVAGTCSAGVDADSFSISVICAGMLPAGIPPDDPSAGEHNVSLIAMSGMLGVAFLDDMAEAGKIHIGKASGWLWGSANAVQSEGSGNP